MKTDDLIAALSRQTPAVAPRVAEKRLAAAALLALLGGAAVVLTLFGPREDLGAFPPAYLLKTAFGVIMALAAVPLVLRASRPAGRLTAALAPLALLLAVSLAGAVVATIATPAAERAAALAPYGFPACLKQIPMTAIPGGVFVFLVFRGLAPTRLVHAGAAAGAAAGGLAVMTYAMHCPIDSWAYVLAWYPLGVAICAAVGALLGPRLLRW